MQRVSGTRTGLPVTLRACVELISYALVLAFVVTGSAVAVGIGSGGGVGRAKELSFFLGWGVVAYATAQLWARADESVYEDHQTAISDQNRTRFQQLVHQLPPVRWVQLPPPEQRFRTSLKLFIGGVGVLLASFLMETVFGVG